MKQPAPDPASEFPSGGKSIWTFGQDLWIETPVDRPVDAAMRIVFAALESPPQTAISRDRAFLTLDVQPIADRDALYLCAGNEPLYRIEKKNQLVPAVESLVTHLFARTQRRAQVLHMGMVAWGDCGILLPGDRGSGKSTLSVWLAQNGATYFGDDLIAYDPDSHSLAGLPKAATLKYGSFALFPETRTYEDPIRGPVRYILPPQIATAPLPLPQIQALVFPEYTKAGGEPQRLSSAWAALAMVQQLLGGVEWNDEALQLVGQLAAIPAFRLPFADLNTATAHVRSIATGDA